MICPKCKKIYMERPAVSQVNPNMQICPLCGAKEALQAAVSAKVISYEEGEEIYRIIKSFE